MPNFSLRPSTALIFTLLAFFSQNIVAQKAGLEVNRTSAMDRALPVLNVAIDGQGRKWAANSKGVFQIKAADFATRRNIPVGEKSVLSYRGGNADFTWSEAAFKTQVKTDCTVTAAWYDEKTSTLWLGTDEAGLFQFKTTPELQLVQQYVTSNSKLKSNNITVIFQDKTNRLWVGTDKGLMYGPPGRWKADFANYEVQRIREYGNVTYVLADGEISLAPGGDKWSDLPLDIKKLEGQIADFDIDLGGKMWIVSGVLTRYDMLGETYDVFSGPEYYTTEFGTCVAIDFDGAVWVGSSDKGLYQVDKASSMTLNAYVDVPISCEGNGKDAVLVAKVTGGFPPYIYTWSGGLSGDNPKNVGQGNYTVTVTDSKGKARSIEVPVPDARLRIKARQKKPVSAPGKTDATAEVDIESNASGLLISWDNGEAMAVATQLSAGAHTVTVTDPKGCSATTSVTITEKNIPLVVVILEKTRIGCAGDPAASVAVQVSGGKAPFKYTWSNSALTGEQPTGIKAGDYQVTVTDAAGTTSAAAVSIRQPESLTATVAATGPASVGNADGKALAQAKGGTGAHSFKWDNGESSAAASKLASGQHAVTVTDANGCWVSTTVSISENILPLSIVISQKSKIKCAGEKSGSLAVQVSGGKAPFKYSWSNAALTGEQPANVQAGDYQLTVTDAAGTSSTASVSVKQPDALAATATATAPASSGNADGKATAQATGGASNYNFKWDDGENGGNAVKLAPGQRSVIVTDANGCSATATVVISENILPLSIVISQKSKIKCAGEKSGSLTVQVTGGKAPFKYAWSVPALRDEQPANVQAGDYQLTVTDAAGTVSTANISIKQPEVLTATAAATSPASTGNTDGKAIAQATGGASNYTFKWDNGETSAAAVKLAPGQRSVTITDANGCSATATVVISENILPLSIVISQKSKIKCAGAKSALDVKVSGGKPPYSFVWNNPALRDEQPGDLGAGEYAVTATDALGTSQTASIAVQSPDSLSVELTRNIGATTERSNDGKAVLTVKGGTGKHTIVWDTKQTGSTAMKLPLGPHSVTVTDANGCFQKIDFETEKRVLPELTGNIENGQVIRMRRLNFETDSYTLQNESLPMLDELYDFMMENGSAAIEIAGHTNNQPTDAFADELSANRAKAVADYLTGKGIDQKRVIYKGYGKRFPLVPNTSAEGRRTNQRVEIKILRVSN